jgi:uncharacterized protein YyaL (SSP411 family)
MLYDNAEIPRAFLAGYQLTGRKRYAEVVRETVDFLQRELQHPDGGFYSTLDARSAPPADPAGDHEEGAFYVWTPEDVREAVDDETATDLFCDRYGVRPGGNFEDGQTVLTETTSLDDLAEEYDLDSATVQDHTDEDRLADAREQVFAARSERPRPPRDEKVLAGWNGLTISMLAEAGVVLDDDYTAVAADALSFVRETLWDGGDRRLQRRYKDGETNIDGYLEDYAFLGRGAFDLYQATGDVDQLVFALELARAIEEKFWDDQAGTLYFTPAGGESLIARPQEVTDQSTPSSAGVAAELLLSLSHFAAHDRFAEIAQRVLETHASNVESNPLQHASLTMAADRYASGSLELTLVADDQPAVWLETLGDRYLPTRLLAWRPAEESDFAVWLDRLDLPEAPSVWAKRDQRDGEPTVYACRSFTCSPPRHSVAAALDWATSELE